jgi:predicted lipoprotein with Yx(FWY)xxD motif
MIKSLTRLEALRRPRMLLLVLLAAAAVAVVAACSSSGTPSGTSSTSSSGSSTPAAAAAVGLKTAKVGGVTLLTNGQGFTLYTFAPDTSTTSNCNGTCAQNWPPVKGPATASGVKGAFATIKRSDGSTQLTFHGHPLYTFVGDKSPGQASGNDINAFGGLWHETPASGSAAPASTSSSGGGGSGY